MLIVVRNTKSNHHNTDYDLNKGDVVKLGRVKFKIKSLNSPQKYQQLLNYGPGHTQSIVSESDFEQKTIDCEDVPFFNKHGISEKEQVQCKVCWSNE